jgi:hypothetical protein
MFAGIFGWLGNLIAGPLLQKALDAYRAKLTAENGSEKIAADLAARELAVEQREIEVDAQVRTAEIGKWYEPDKIMGYVVALYFGKLLVWDKVLAMWTHGMTDPLAGWASTTANLIVMFYFGKRGFENVARILARK